MPANRPELSGAEVLTALAHPVRLALLNYLMAAGPATASVCAREVGDTPSNCSYHLRKLAEHGLVERAESGDGRERPWRAMITGFSVADAEPGSAAAVPAAALGAVALQVEQHAARDYLAARGSVPRRWRAAEALDNYVLRLTPAEMAELHDGLDALIRPYVAATRTDAPRGAALVRAGVQMFLHGSARSRPES